LSKDKAKNFVIAFTSSPFKASERPVIPFVDQWRLSRRRCNAGRHRCLALRGLLYGQVKNVHTELPGVF